jgi:hypothetical protein
MKIMLQGATPDKKYGLGAIMWTSKGATGIVAATLCVGFLSACDDISRWQNRYGPDPSLAAIDVASTMNNQRLVLDALRAIVDESTTDRTNYWYQVAQAGFLYVDVKCDIYLTNMFKFERERDRIRGTLTIIDKGVGAILGFANNDKATIQIVAQAFGMAAGVTDVVADSYIFKVAPGIVTGTVVKLREDYWDQAARKREAINSPTAALAAIRGYLEICLPPYLEGKIAETVAKAVAKPKTPENGVTTIVTTAPPARAASRALRSRERSDAGVSPRFGSELVSPAF